MLRKYREYRLKEENRRITRYLDTIDQIDSEQWPDDVVAVKRMLNEATVRQAKLIKALRRST